MHTPLYTESGRVARRTRTGFAASKTAAYLWCAFGLLSLLAVIFGTGGWENLTAGLACSLFGVWRLSVIHGRDYRADLESYRANRHDADVAWWLNAYRTSESFAEREAARQLLSYWGHRPAESPAAGGGPLVPLNRDQLVHEARVALANLSAANRTAAGDIILRDTRYPRNIR